MIHLPRLLRAPASSGEGSDRNGIIVYGILWMFVAPCWFWNDLETKIASWFIYVHLLPMFFFLMCFVYKAALTTWEPLPATLPAWGTSWSLARQGPNRLDREWTWQKSRRYRSAAMFPLNLWVTLAAVDRHLKFGPGLGGLWPPAVQLLYAQWRPDVKVMAATSLSYTLLSPPDFWMLLDDFGPD